MPSAFPHPPQGHAHGSPVGLQLARAAKSVSRAFDETMAAAGGSVPTWLILLNLMGGRPGNQRELAESIGIQGATLTHHLNGMEAEGLVTRRRDPANRRVHLVQLTPAGEELFHQLVKAATAFDRRLRSGLSEGELAALGDVLDRLVANAEGGPAEG